MRSRHFDMLLQEAVDEGLSSLGNSSKQVLYFYLEKTFKINKSDIPHKIEEFTDAIEKIFGLGAKFLEILIMKRLYEKVGEVLEFGQDWEGLVVTEYIAAIKQSYMEKKRREALQHKEMKVKA